MKKQTFLLVLALIPFLVLLEIFSAPFVLMLNKIFIQKSFPQIIKFMFAFNFSFSLIYFISFFLATDFSMKVYRIVNYYLGFLVYAFLIGLVFWLLYYSFGFFGVEYLINTKLIGTIFIAIFLFVNFLAIYNFEKDIAVEKFEIKTDKVKKDYTIVQIGDIQYGSVSKEYMENVLKLAMEQNPDFIVFVGDLIDFEGYKSEDFKSFEELTVPFYFINGNHDFYHNQERLFSYLKKIKPINVLIDEKADFEEIEIIGIDYVLNKRKLIDKIDNIELNNDKFSILLYHEPKAVDYGIKKGFDLMLYGHTHGGQIFPITKIVDFIYKFGNGFYKRGDTSIYTTDGAGLWGPRMRLGSQNEIAVFNVISDN